MSQVVCVIGGNAVTLIAFRGALMKALRAQGNRVVAIAPEISIFPKAVKWLKKEDIVAENVQFQRTGLSPVNDFKLLCNLFVLFRRHRPDLVLGSTIKPVIYGTIAGWLAGVRRRYVLITGLGYVFTGDARGRRAVIRCIVQALYRLALARADGVIFQNTDDAALFSELGLLRNGVPVHVVNGSGVDLEHYKPKALPPSETGPTFLMVARLLVTKGVREYAAAAMALKKEYPHSRFVLAGGIDVNPDVIPLGELTGWLSEGSLEWSGALEDVRPMLGDCHVFVLPSYREGTPRAVLEAMATGRAIITTDAPGCRETVADGENGFLVPVGDASSLAVAMRRFLDDPSLIQTMGRKSLEIAQSKYDVKLVNKEMLEVMRVTSPHVP